jgi:hypothetical protein
MKYYNLKKKVSLPNKKIDAFLIEMNFLCKRHKMAINCENNYMVIKTYNKKSAEKMLSKVGDDLEISKKE